jgi:hypothetical protein
MISNIFANNTTKGGVYFARQSSQCYFLMLFLHLANKLFVGTIDPNEKISWRTFVVSKSGDNVAQSKKGGLCTHSTKCLSLFIKIWKNFSL